MLVNEEELHKLSLYFLDEIKSKIEQNWATLEQAGIFSESAIIYPSVFFVLRGFFCDIWIGIQFCTTQYIIMPSKKFTQLCFFRH